LDYFFCFSFQKPRQLHLQINSLASPPKLTFWHEDTIIQYRYYRHDSEGT
jgi:hypothetical protein